MNVSLLRLAKIARGAPSGEIRFRWKQLAAAKTEQLRREVEARASETKATK